MDLTEDEKAKRLKANKWNDEEKEIRLFREAEREVGIELGIEQGIEKILCSQVRKKLRKNKTLEQIVEELEVDIEAIRPIYEKLCKENKENIYNSYAKYTF